MRIADTTRFRNIQDQVTRAQSAHADAARQASSGLRVGAPSDDPVAAAQALRVGHSISRTATFRNTINSVRGDIVLAESTLASAEDVVQRLREVALQGGSGPLNVDRQQAFALEVGLLKDQLLGLANQKGSQGYLFGGTKTATPPFSTAGAFSGDALDRSAEVGQGVLIPVNTSGAKAFTAAGGRDIFADIDTLQAAFAANDQAAVLATVNGLDAGTRQILAARTDAGLKLARLDAAEATHEQTNVALETQRHELIDSDPAQAYSRLAQMQHQLESAVGVSKNLLDTLASTTAALR